MHRKYFPLVLLFLVLLSNVTISQNNNYYKKAWERVDSLKKKRLPKSVYAEADKIYYKAKQDKDYLEQIKALSLKYDYVENVEKNGKLNFLKNINKELNGLDFPYNAIMHSFIADKFFGYLNSNGYKINNIDITDDNNETIEQWDRKDYVDKIDYHFQQSLKENKDFRKLKIEDYKRIFFVDSLVTEDLNLYELLATNALDFYFSTNWMLEDYNYTFINTDFFKPAKDFVSVDISEYKEEILKYRGLLVLQDLMRFILKTRSKEALVRNELLRYQLIYKKYAGENKNDLFIKALENIEQDYNNKEVANVYYAHASFLVANSNEIMGCQGEEKNYYYRKTAGQLCEKSLERYRESTGAKRCENLLVSIKKKKLELTSELVLPSNKIFPVLLEYRNTDTVWLRVWRLKSDSVFWEERFMEKYKLTKDAKLISSKEYLLKGGSDYNLHTTEILLKGLDYGKYLIEFTTEKEYPSKQYSIALISVSDIYYKQRSRDSISEIRILDRNTGQPIEGAKFTYWIQKWVRGEMTKKDIKEKYSDSNGLVIIKEGGNNIGFQISKGKDTLSSGSFYAPVNHKRESSPEIKIFTDRAIYRPGEKVYFKAIVFKGEGDKCKVLKDKKVKLEFKDAHYNNVSEQELITNEYGSVSGSFSIPYKTLTGRFTIRSTYTGYHGIRVEEYKVPKFEVKSEKLKKQYKYNDTISVDAQALTFNNVAVSHAKFEYKIYRNEYDIVRSYYLNRDKGDLIYSGKGKTDSQGKLNFSFVAQPSGLLEKNKVTKFTYEIAVTDINGETHTVSDGFRLSSQSLFIRTDLKDWLSYKELMDGIELSTKNIDDVNIPADLKVEMIRLKGQVTPLADRLWDKPSCRLYAEQEWKKLYPGHVYAEENNIENYKEDGIEGTFALNTGKSKKLRIRTRKAIPSGPYLLKVTAKDKDGKEVTYKKAFTLYKPESKKNPDSKYLWAECSHEKALAGDTITFTYGSSKGMDILYELISKDKLIKSEKIHLNNEQRKILIPIEESFRGGIEILLYAVYDNRYYTTYKEIDIPYNNKDLDVSFKSFRDKLLPGEQEAWTIKIKDYKNKFADAEMLATLYDASLDKLSSNSWKFDPYSGYYNRPIWNSEGNNKWNWRFVDKNKYIQRDIDAGSFVCFIWKDLEQAFGDFMGVSYRNVVVTGYGVNSRLKIRGRASLQGEVVLYDEDEEELEDELEIAEEAEDEVAGQGIIQSPFPEDIQIRKNFVSTAFFYPFLRTDENGDVEIKFTVPESLTRWKMMGMAHTKDLSLGFITKYLETRKDLMVISNAPRFLREGDKIEFTTKVSNLSDKDLSGGIKIELSNAVTGEILEIVEGDIARIFNVTSNSNTLVSWNLNIPENISLLKYTVLATTGDFSDGETSVIPVLSKRIMVTKSMPFSVKNAGESMLIVPNLKNILKKESVDPYRMTMEFSSNPVWYAVQSLPYLMEYPYECCEQTFSRYFANKLASHIIRSNSKIKEIYDVWKATASKDKETFMSKLSSNKELKQIVLEETPWLAEAKTQEERMKRLGMLFDLNNMSMEEQRTLSKLFENQNHDGGWPWFKDMRSNRFITQHILTGFGYLGKITGVPERENRIKKALTWSKEEFVKSYARKNIVESGLNFIDLHFLYMATFYKELKFSLGEKLIVDNYLNKCEQYWKDAPLYQKGQAALVLYRNDRQDAAREIVASLKEYAVLDSYYGMYWKENLGGIYSSQAQIEIQSLMIEVFTEITNDKKAIEEMKVWLLNHKRTNSWESTKATVCAIYSLLSGNGGTFDMGTRLKVSVGDKLIFDASKPDNSVEAGTGYVKKVYQKDEISRDMDRITVRKSDDKLVWGALYLQYLDDIDNVSASSTGLEIKKQVLVERINNGKLSYQKVEKDTRLNVGDKLKVILRIKNDFPMEYVHIKDLRASCLEPGFVKSGYGYGNRLYYYISVKDASVNYFIDYLPEGEFSLNYELRVTHKGSFSDGISTIQCMYAPEFQANSKGNRIEVGQ